MVRYQLSLPDEVGRRIVEVDTRDELVIGNETWAEDRRWRVESIDNSGQRVCSPVLWDYVIRPRGEDRYAAGLYEADVADIIGALRPFLTDDAHRARETLEAMATGVQATISFSHGELSEIASAILSLRLSQPLTPTLDDLRVKLHRYLRDHPAG